MKAHDRVDALGLSVLAVTLVISSAVFFIPGPLARVAGRDAWMSPLVGGTAGAVAAFLLARLFFMRREDPIRRTARWPALRLLVGLTFGLFAAHLAGLVTAETSHVFKIVMPETPIVVFATFLAFAAWTMALYGGEVVTRMAQLLFPVMVVTAFSNLALTLPGGADFGELTPVLEFGWRPVLAQVPSVLAWMGEIALLTFFAGHVDQPRATIWYLTAGVLVTALMMSVVTLTAVVVMGPTEVARTLAPTITLARLVRVNPLLSRLETAILTAWLLGIYVKLAVIVHVGGRALEGGVGSPPRWRWAWTTAVAAAAVLEAVEGFPSTLILTEHLQYTWPPLGVGMLVFTLAVGLIPPVAAARGPRR